MREYVALPSADVSIAVLKAIRASSMQIVSCCGDLSGT